MEQDPSVSEPDDAHQQSLADTLNILGEATVVLDHGLRIALINHLAERLLGREGEDLRGQPVTRLLPRRYRGLLGLAQRYLQAGAESGGSRRLELSALHADGREIPLEVSFNRSVVNGRPILTLFLRDITKRKQRREREARRHSLLHALARFSELLLGPGLDAEALSRALALLARPLEAEGIVLYRHEGPDHALPALHCLAAQGPAHVARQLDTLDYRREPLLDALPRLVAGNALVSLEDLLLAPIHDRDDWIGLLAVFSPRRADTGLDEIEDLVLTAARLLGSALALHAQTRALELSERRYRALFDDTPDLYFILDAHGTVTECNRSAREQLGPDEIAGQPFEALVHPSDRPRLHHHLQSLLDGGRQSADIEYRLLTRHDHVLWVHHRAVQGRDEEGAERLHLLCRDVTSRRLAELALRESQEHYRRTFRIAAVALWEVDITPLVDRLLPLRAQGPEALRRFLDEHPGFLEEAAQRMQVLQANAAAVELMGATSEQDLIGPFDPRIAADALPAFRRLVLAIGEGSDRFQGEFRCLTCQGETRDVLLSAALPVAASGGHMILSMTDISRIKELERQLSHSARHDHLTGLANRVLLHDRIEQALARMQRNGSLLALLYLDLDRFKPINDRYGHETGDRVLREVAQRLRQVVRDSDTVCRYGGDEFIILIDDLQHEADAENIALKLLALLRQPMEIDGRSLRVDASIGIALAPRDGSTPDQLIGQADRAMYRAKQSGLGIAG